ncbi:MAG TPA: hypothetical protein PKD55_01510 [Bellilinea sp.]|nr:hypothetical protein [Bellilinea sp.]
MRKYILQDADIVVKRPFNNEYWFFFDDELMVIHGDTIKFYEMGEIDQILLDTFEGHSKVLARTSDLGFGYLHSSGLIE